MAEESYYDGTGPTPAARWVGEGPAPAGFSFQMLLDRAVHAITAIGGRLEPERCVNRYPAYDDGHPEPDAGGCGGRTVVVIPYDRLDGTPGFQRCCLICDAVLAWPPFG